MSLTTTFQIQYQEKTRCGNKSLNRVLLESVATFKDFCNARGPIKNLTVTESHSDFNDMIILKATGMRWGMGFNWNAFINYDKSKLNHGYPQT